ncbi:MAG: metallophosphoesterase [Clostridia bacterium]|nr:metallophosphoesterase [Clostridia bacterium]
MKLGIFSDLHYCSADNLGLGRRPLLGIERLKIAINAFKEQEVDACVCLGDMIDRAIGDGREQILEYLKGAVSIIRASEIPFFLVPGNHDFLALSRKDFKSEGVELAPLVKKIGDFTLIMLDANYRADMRHFDTSGEKWDDANLPNEQLKALDTALLSADGPCIVLIHENLDPCVDFSHQVRNASEVNEVISRHASKVKLVLQGHFHYGADNTLYGVPYHTVKSMCVFNTDFYEIIEL